MRKSKQFLGMPVISLEEGQQVGSIRGLVVNPALKRVAALIIEQKGWFRDQKFIPYCKVYSIGEDAITIDRSNKVEKGASLPEILKLFQERIGVIGSRLVAESGTLLGVVEEYYVDLKTGDIVGLEFSGGGLSNLMKGSAFLDINYVRTIGTTVVVCSDTSLDNAVKMDGGLQESLRSIRDNTGQLLENTFQKTKELGRNINQSIEKKRRDKKTGNNSSAEPGGEEEMPVCACGCGDEEKANTEDLSGRESEDRSQKTE